MQCERKSALEEAGQLSKGRARRKANLVREEAFKKASKASKTKRKKRAAEEIEQSTRDQARKGAYLAREQVIAKAQEARKFKAKKQPPK